VLGFVVGLKAEARIAARFGGLVRSGGGTTAGAHQAADDLIRQGVTALVSFGLAGGLDPTLWPGDVVVASQVLLDDRRLTANAALATRFGGPTGHTILAGAAVVADAAAKAHLFETTGAHAVDLESGAVARAAIAHGLPFAVVRAICDPSERDLPPAALIALDPAGRIGLAALIRSVLAQPTQIAGLLRLGRDAARARRALISVVRRFQAVQA
jgi:adenosylhomocysteine nucleosidase